MPRMFGRRMAHSANRIPPRNRSHRAEHRRRYWAVGLAVLMAGILIARGWAQEGFNREYTIKAAYLYQLGRYITWPSQAFAGPQSPFVIGVLEPDFVGPDLRKIAGAKTLDGRPIEVKTFARPEDVQQCHILYLPRGAEAKLPKALMSRLAGTHTLLVGESEEFLDRGGAIAFVVRENNVRLIIALEAAQREQLQVSSKLLQIALPKL